MHKASTVLPVDLVLCGLSGSTPWQMNWRQFFFGNICPSQRFFKRYWYMSGRILVKFHGSCHWSQLFLQPFRVSISFARLKKSQAYRKIYISLAILQGNCRIVLKLMTSFGMVDIFSPKLERNVCKFVPTCTSSTVGHLFVLVVKEKRLGRRGLNKFLVPRKGSLRTQTHFGLSLL